MQARWTQAVKLAVACAVALSTSGCWTMQGGNPARTGQADWATNGVAPANVHLTQVRTIPFLSVGGGTLSSPVFDSHGTMYFGDSKGYAHAVSASGAELWSTNIAGTGHIATPAVAGNLVYFADPGTSFLYALETKNGHYNMPASASDPARDPSSIGWRAGLGGTVVNVADAPPVVADVGDANGPVVFTLIGQTQPDGSIAYRVDGRYASNGALVWKIPVTGTPSTPVTVIGLDLYVGSKQGRVNHWKLFKVTRKPSDPPIDGWPAALFPPKGLPAEPHAIVGVTGDATTGTVYVTSSRLARVNLDLQPLSSVNGSPSIYAQDGAGNIAKVTSKPVIGGGCGSVDCSGGNSLRVYAITPDPYTQGKGCVTWWDPQNAWNTPNRVQCGVGLTSGLSVAPWDYPLPSADPAQTVHSEMVITSLPITATEYTAANTLIPANAPNGAAPGTEPALSPVIVGMSAVGDNIAIAVAGGGMAIYKLQ